jgi:hypothetical protein
MEKGCREEMQSRRKRVAEGVRFQDRNLLSHQGFLDPFIALIERYIAVEKTNDY